MKKIYYLLSFLALSLPVNAQNISTLAGTVSSGFSGDGGQATAAQLFHPKAMTTDDTGNVYIADADNNVIRKVSTTGVITTFAGLPAGGFSGDGGPAIYALLNRPNSIAFDRKRNLYICDADNQRVRMVDTAGNIRTVAGIGTAGFSGDGGSATAAELNYPGGIALDKYGDLFITDEYNNRIRMVDSDGVITTFAGNGMTGYPGDAEFADTAAIGFPFGIVADTADNVYFSLTLDNRICKINTAHIITSIAGVGGGTGAYGGDGGAATAAQFDNPWGIALDIFGNLYIADNANERIRMVNISGTISTVAGTGSAGFSGDGGPATLGQLKQPAGVHVDNAGNMYIADYNNHRVRKVNGSITLGTNNVVKNTLSVSVAPQPSDGSFMLTVSSAADENIDISITDITGRVVKQMSVASNKQVAVHLDVPPGMYTLNASGAYGSCNEKLVIEK